MPQRNVTIATTSAEQGTGLGGQNNTSARSYTRSDLYTNVITVEMINTEQKRDCGSRITIADARSIKDGKPATRHGMTTLTSKYTECMNIMSPPKGVVLMASGMKPPEAHVNPYKSISWCWMTTSYGISAAAAKKATNYITDMGLDTIKKAFLETDIAAKNAKKDPFSAKAGPFCPMCCTMHFGTRVYIA